MSERLANKIARAHLVIWVMSMAIGIPSVIYVGNALWYGGADEWLPFVALCLVPVVLWAIHRLTETKEDRAWRELDEEAERDRKP